MAPKAPEMVPPRDLFTAGDSPGRLVVDYAAAFDAAIAATEGDRAPRALTAPPSPRTLTGDSSSAGADARNGRDPGPFGCVTWA